MIRKLLIDAINLELKTCSTDLLKAIYWTIRSLHERKYVYGKRKVNSTDTIDRGRGSE